MTATNLWDPDQLLDYLSRSANELLPGGVFAVRALRSSRLNPDNALATLVDRGMVSRLRRGWYAFEGADAAVVTAVRSGGVLSCVSALRFHGIWTPLAASSTIHARAATSGIELRAPVRTCSPRRRIPAPQSAVDSPLLALRTASCCLDSDAFVAAIDSAVCLGLVTSDAVHTVLEGAPRLVRRNARRVGLAESGTETLVRLRLRARHISVQTQVEIEGVGRVDMVLGNRVVLEVDSRAHHTGVENYQSDKWRDLRLFALGYVVIRVSWEQVMFDWSEVEELIVAGLAKTTRRS